MANQGFYIDASQLKMGAKNIDMLIKAMPGKLSDVLNASAKAIERDAKRAAPADRGFLRRGIDIDISNPLIKHITSHAPYSAYVEFGTGKYAAQYVGSLPPDFQAFAAQFKGKSGMAGGFYEFVVAILDWIKRKGIVSKHAEYRVSSKINKEGKLTTRRTRLGSKKVKFEQDYKLASAIAFNILKNGVHPHPFLLPAFFDRQDKLRNDILNLLNRLKL